MLKRIKKLWKTLKAPSWKKFIENWTGHDYVAGLITMLFVNMGILLIWRVSAIHLWDLFRFHYVDMLLVVVAAICYRYCVILYIARGIPKFKTDWPIFWDRNGLIVGLFGAGTLALALIDPQLTTRIISVFR